MNKSLKKIIAREGLVMVSLIVSAIILFLLSHWQSTYISKRVSPNPERIKAVLDKVQRLDENRVICPNGQKIKFDSKPTDEDIYWACTASEHEVAKDLSQVPDKELYDLANTPMKERYFVQRIDFEMWGVFLLFGSYPLYLLIRFIIWAIKTLRQR